MPKANVFNMAGEKIGEIELSEAIFGIEPNKSVLHDSVKNHLANCRQGTQSALTKGEVSYTTKKPWRQKGTGRARAGYAGSPVWYHGGVAFAPKPRDYSYTLNKKVKRLAMKSALSAKAAEDEIIVIDGLQVEEIKTKAFKSFLTKIGVEGKALVVTENVDEKVVKSARNIAGVNTTIATVLSPYMILTNGKMVVDKAALAKIEEVFA
ncbi:MAG: 50S ribosomal protein L4 [Candidatus Limivicinus sp.]|nr:50S ribosomal protein L4 [Clostridiales bacterium]MCI7741727.1 50S ribosomal protein L4 [Clostridiales bacterium]MDY4488711.1 50S ribosomal protein L4 [Candidatus Limivicinus sp.]MDY6131897.1 50S ribosomal protein L4 [Candidatus Limivicinus sp.]